MEALHALDISNWQDRQHGMAVLYGTKIGSFIIAE
jgi:hypothetical protein